MNRRGFLKRVTAAVAAATLAAAGADKVAAKAPEALRFANLSKAYSSFVAAGVSKPLPASPALTSLSDANALVSGTYETTYALKHADPVSEMSSPHYRPQNFLGWNIYREENGQPVFDRYAATGEAIDPDLPKIFSVEPVIGYTAIAPRAYSRSNLGIVSKEFGKPVAWLEKTYSAEQIDAITDFIMR